MDGSSQKQTPFSETECMKQSTQKQRVHRKNRVYGKGGLGLRGVGSLHDGFGGFDGFGGSGEHLALLFLVLQNTAQ